MTVFFYEENKNEKYFFTFRPGSRRKSFGIKNPDFI